MWWQLSFLDFFNSASPRGMRLKALKCYGRIIRDKQSKSLSSQAQLSTLDHIHDWRFKSWWKYDRTVKLFQFRHCSYFWMIWQQGKCVTIFCPSRPQEDFWVGHFFATVACSASVLFVSLWRHHYSGPLRYIFTRLIKKWTWLSVITYTGQDTEWPYW